MTYFTIFPYDAYFEFVRSLITSPSFFSSYLKFGVALRGVALFYRGCVQFLNAVVAIYIQNGPIGIKGITFYSPDAQPQRGFIKRTAEVLFTSVQCILCLPTFGDVVNRKDHQAQPIKAAPRHGDCGLKQGAILTAKRLFHSSSDVTASSDTRVQELLQPFLMNFTYLLPQQDVCRLIQGFFLAILEYLLSRAVEKNEPALGVHSDDGVQTRLNNRSQTL